MSEQNASSPGEGRRISLSHRTAALVWAIILAVDLGGLYFFESRGLSDLYGDAIAHVEGARRLFDSLTPGYREIGTVWLPLFHLLAAPLAINTTLWRTGLAGSLISATAFAFTAWFVFILASEMNRNFAAGILALAGLLLCVSLLYLASAPMTEVLAMLWAVLVVFFLFRFQQSGSKGALVGASVAAFLGTLTRYDGWYLLPFAALFVLLGRSRAWKDRLRQTLLFAVIAGCGPVLWLAHNAYRFHNPLEFYEGPGSAKAIYAHQLVTTGFRYPTDGSLWISAHYYVQDLRLVIGPWSMMLAVLGVMVWILEKEERRQRSAALLLLVPLPFYFESLAFSGVALYVPTLFPHTYYNLRYGLEMAPALAVLPSFLLSGRLTAAKRLVLLGVFIVILAGQWIGATWAGARKIPVVTEAILNTPCRADAQHDVIRFLQARYAGGDLLLAAKEWPCVMPQVGIPYHDTVTPMSQTFRRQPDERMKNIQWIVLERGDEVDQLMRKLPKLFADFDLVDFQSLSHGSYVKIFRRSGKCRGVAVVV